MQVIRSCSVTNPSPHDLKALLLQERNLSIEEEKEFLFPSYNLGVVWDFADMEHAVSRIKVALDTGEHIGIYADYDCDGIPAAVLLVDLFTALGAQDRVHVYIPDRHDEGYGLSAHGIDELEKSNVTLIITVDLGITALAEVADAQSRGIDIIVTDHHACLSTQAGDISTPLYPAAYAVVHPQKGTYHNKDLCGAGVAFMVARAILERYGSLYGVSNGWEKWLLDLVGFATLSDMVPLTGENRVLAAYGLMVMKKTRRVGLQVLMAETMIDIARLTETDLTFTVAPRLNAASRMATPMLAYELLSTKDVSRAKALVAELTKINDERKLLVARIVKDAHHRLDVRELPPIVVIGDLTWRPAVLGLVANKLQETYNRSFFVWGEAGDGTFKGSCRMLPIHHAAYLFQALPDTALIHAGGHQAAGGFAVSRAQVHFLEQHLNTAAEEMPDLETKDDDVYIRVPLSIVTTRHLQMIRQFAPFGVGNREPVFLFEHATIQSVKKFGKTKEHIECVVKDDFGTATAFTFFASAALIEKLAPEAQISFVATLEQGWRGGVRLKIKDVL